MCHAQSVRTLIGNEGRTQKSNSTGGNKQSARSPRPRLPCTSQPPLTLTAAHRSLVSERHPRVLLEQLLDLAEVRSHEGLVRRDDVLVATDGLEDHLRTTRQQRKDDDNGFDKQQN